MKTLTAFILGVAFIALTAFTVYQTDKKAAAQVQKVEGIYIFVKSTPASQYDFLGTVTGPVIGSHEFDKLLNSMLKDLKKKYPEANGLIFDGPIKQSQNTKASAIKIKE